MIDIIDRQTVLSFSEDGRQAVEKAANAALSMFDVAHPLLCVAIVDDAQIHELNRRFRGQDRPTDVLSFAAREGEKLETGRKGEYLGDVIISLETAKRQAEEYGHSLLRELAFLTAHGALHLLGYDHMTAEDEREMFALQDDIMRGIGLAR